MKHNLLFSTLVASMLLSQSASLFAHDDLVKKSHNHKQEKEVNLEQIQAIKDKSLGNGNYNYPYNHYNPRHIKSKNTLQQVGKEVNDDVVDTLTEQLFDLAPMDLASEREYLSVISNNKKNKNKKFAYPENFSHPKFSNARQVSSNDSGELNYTLNVQYADHQFKTLQMGKEVTKNLHLRSYDGELVGPTFIVKPGDTLKIKMKNLLPPEMHNMECEGECDHDHTTPHGFNTTNLHTHGLHVDPTGKSDNVFIKLKSGDEFDYEIHIPEDHVAGTFWYHAHVHGSTTVQVGSGVHGAIIIRGDYDNIPAITKAKERVMVLQTIAFDEQGEIENNDNYFVEKWHPEGWQRGWHVSVNGQVMPEIEIQPGTTELWRFVHAGIREYMNLRLVNSCDSRFDIPLVQLAADGIAFRKKRLADDKGTFMAPGYRSDVMIKAKRRGVYYLIDASVEGAADLPDSYCGKRRGDSVFELDEKAQNIIARVTVKGPRKRMPLPKNKQLKKINRPVSIQDDELSDDIEYSIFNITPKDGVDPSDPDQFIGDNFNFTINGKTYDPDQPRNLKLNNAQTWILRSEFYFHPYHIHVNPFEVISRDDSGKIIDRYWRDTVLVWPAETGQPIDSADIEIRTRYEDFAGSFVMHCHILDHEYRGMMEKVNILT